MSEDNIKAVIEALLFVSEKPLTLVQIKNVLDTLESNEIRSILEEMKYEYERFNRGIQIREVAGGFQMIAAQTLSPFLKKLYKQHKIKRLSRPSLETLAIVAYKQPVTRLQVESIRDVNSEGIIKNLLERDLIRVSGRKKAPGRPKVYSTTRQFLEYFGLRSLEELPRIENFSQMKPQLSEQ